MVKHDGASQVQRQSMLTVCRYLAGIYPAANSTSQDVSMTTVFEVMKLDVVEADSNADDTNQNIQTVSESVSVAPTTITASLVTDANLNNPPDKESTT